jgi:glycine cleavage system H protein
MRRCPFLARYTGTVVAVNSALEKSPELINKEPYAGGWMVKLKPSDAAEFDALLDAAAYEQLLKDEEHA